jgi:hypothetical protein
MLSSAATAAASAWLFVFGVVLDQEPLPVGCNFATISMTTRDTTS